MFLSSGSSEVSAIPADKRQPSHSHADAVSSNCCVALQDKQEAQQRKLERLQHQLAQGEKERQLLEAHANVLDKALMKISMEHAEVQVGGPPHAALQCKPFMPSNNSKSAVI